MAQFMNTYFNGKCGICRIGIRKGQRIWHDDSRPTGRKAICSPCAESHLGEIDPEPDRKPRKRRTKAEMILDQWKEREKMSPAPVEPSPAPVEPSPAPVEPSPTSPDDLARVLADVLGRLNGKLDESRVVELIKEHASPLPPREIVHQIEIRRDDRIEKIEGYTHKALPDILTAIPFSPVFLPGPPASGKTTLGQQVADVMTEGKFTYIGATDSPYRLSGHKGPSGEYIRTPFREVFENGGTVMFDELDRWSNGAVLFLQSATSNAFCDFPDQRIQAHPDFYVIAAGNTHLGGGDRLYCGANQLDAAFVDRFIFIEVDYDEGLELQISENEAWTRRVQKLRRAAASLNMRVVISPRASIKGGKLLAAGMAWPKVEEMTIWQGMNKEQRAKIEQAAL